MATGIVGTTLATGSWRHTGDGYRGCCGRGVFTGGVATTAAWFDRQGRLPALLGLFFRDRKFVEFNFPFLRELFRRDQSHLRLGEFFAQRFELFFRVREFFAQRFELFFRVREFFAQRFQHLLRLFDVGICRFSDFRFRQLLRQPGDFRRVASCVQAVVDS